MEYEKVLVFRNNRTASVWFDNVVHFLKAHDMFLKAYKATRMIIVKHQVIYFKAHREVNPAFTRGRHRAIYYYNAEKQLEEEFMQTIKELLNGEERDADFR